MLYLIFPTEQEAIDRTQEIATEQGCTGDITLYWFGWIVHPSSTETALQVPDDQVGYLTPTEQSELKDQAYMDANGWFPTDNNDDN